MAEKLNFGPEQLKELIGNYLDRVKKQLPEHCYELDKIGTWQILSGIDFVNAGWINDSESLGFYRGRFIDVVAEAVQLKEFYGKYVGKDNPNGFSRPGCIISVRVEEISKNESLADLIKP